MQHDRIYQSVYITDPGDLDIVASACRSSKTIGLDLETTSFDPRLGKPRLLSLNPDASPDIFVVDLFRVGGMGPIREELHNPDAEVRGRPIVVGQNLKFDQKWLLHHFDVALWPIFDTYRASKLLHNGRKAGHKLEELYQRELDTDTKVPAMGGSDWGAEELSGVQLDYATEDVFFLPMLRDKLRPKLGDKGLNKVALLEFQAVLPEASMELNGFRIDREKWLALSNANWVKAQRLRDELLEELPHPDGQVGLFGGAPWNLDSPDQMLRSLERKGIKLADTRRTTMKMQAAKHPIIDRIVSYREASKRWSAFGPDYLQHLHPVTGRVHTSFYPFTGAGRYACLAAGSPVRTSTGERPIEAVKVGDFVWTHRGRWRPVVATHQKGLREAYVVRFSSGDILTCASSHRFLSSGGEWLDVEGMYREYFEDVDGGAVEHRCGSSVVSESEAIDAAADRGRARNNLSQRAARDEGRDAAVGEEGAKGATLFSHEEGVQESDVGEEGGGAPQLERAVRGRLWLPDVPSRRETPIRASGSHGGGTGTSGDSGELFGASHRWRHAEQCARQLGSGDECRAPSLALYAGQGQPLVAVEAIYPCGSVEVYDLTVEEDESYESAGVFSHNSSSPNLQQIPRGKAFRACFCPEVGWVLIGADYSQIELRIMAQLSMDPVLLDIFRSGKDPHRITASIVLGIPVEEVTDEQRQMAKPINFGLIYGLMPKKLVTYAWANYGVKMTEEQATTFYNRFFEAYEGVRRWQRHVMNWQRPKGFSRTLGGRLRYLESDADYNNFYNCVDAETEALTRRGWVKGPDLRREDVLLTKSADTGALEWQPMTDLKLFPDYKGRLVSFRSRTFNAVTTPEHRWLVSDKHSGEDVCRTSDRLSQWGDHRIHRVGFYDGPKPTFSDDFVELAGWLFTDGTLCEQKGRKVARLYQSARANPEKVDRIDTLFERLGAEVLTGRYYYPKHGHRVTWELRREHAERLHKAFPGRLPTAGFLNGLSREQAQLLLEVMLLGDGWTEDGGRRRFCCRSKAAADAFQVVCVLAGVATTCVERDMSKYEPKSEKLSNVPKGGRHYVVNLLKRTHVQVLQGHREDRDVDGAFVWCPVVPNTYFVARREGQVYVTGNTPDQGTGADGLKNALWKVYHRLRRFGDDVRMVHMVHDEIIAEARDDEGLVEEVKVEIELGMKEGIQPFLPDVPVEVDAHSGYSWAEIH